MIAYFGEGLPGVLPARAAADRATMSPGEISGQYVRYIGAGAVATGGILSMLNALPLIVASITGSLRDLRSGKGRRPTATAYGAATERDLPMPARAPRHRSAWWPAIAASHLIPTDTHRPGRSAA